MKKIYSVLVLSLGLVGTAMAATAAKAAAPVSILYVQTAKTAILTANTLTLNDVSPHTLWFTDRPARKYGVMSTRTFIQRWNANTDNQSFKAVPPNAAVVDAMVQYQDVHEVTSDQELVVTLDQPTYNASSHTLIYQVKYLKSTDAVKLPQTMDHPHVFIDSWATGLQGGGSGGEPTSVSAYG